ncbi:MAG: integrin alpha [Planctomycetota bacterium]
MLLPALLAASAVTAAQQAPLLKTTGGALGDSHGFSLSGGSDYDGDQVPDFLVGEPFALGSLGRVRAVSGATGAALFTLPGAGPGMDFYGTSVLDLGDVDGDGLPEFAVGGTVGGGTTNGYVDFFTANAFGAGATLRNKVPSFFGTSAQFGFHMERIGDLNGDGIDEVLIGAPLSDEPPLGSPTVRVGRIEVHDPVAVVGGSITPVREVYGSVGFGRFGHSSTGIADLNDDDANADIPDFAVGAPEEPNGGGGVGVVRVYSGDLPTMLMATISEATVPGLGTGAGRSLASVADINNDTYDDLAVGVPGNDLTPGGAVEGVVHIISGDWIENGNAPAILATHTAASAHSSQITIGTEEFGHSLVNVGDLDGDGYDELLVGANVGPSWDPDTDPLWPSATTTADSGYVRLISSLDGRVYKIYTPTGGSTSGALFGGAVARLGDMNGDGLPELGIGASAESGRGAAYVFPSDYRFGINFGTPSPNSTGVAGLMGVTGSMNHSANDVTLTASGLPAGNVGIFFIADTATAGSPLADGTVYVAGNPNLFRFPPVTIGSGGTVSQDIDLNMPPFAALIGSGLPKWHYQFWYRDPQAMGMGSNLTDAVTVGLVD